MGFNLFKVDKQKIAELFSLALFNYQRKLALKDLALDFNLRLAQVEDAYDLAKLELESARFEPRQTPLDIPLPDFAKTWKSRIRTSEFTVILAENAQGLMGFVALKGKIKEGFIGALYIAPLFFRQGVGRHLVLLSEEFVILSGGNKLSLDVEMLNIGAIAFYKSLSFAPKAVKSTHLMVFIKEL